MICLSEGHAIYNGPVSKIKEYVETNFDLIFPKYVNPADYLVKLAIQPHLINPLITTSMLKEKCDQAYRNSIDKEIKTFAHYSIKDLENINSVRKSGFAKEYKILFNRLMGSFLRAPIFIWAVFGNAIFSTFLITQVYYKTGNFAMSLDLENNKRGVQNWIGYSFYSSVDMFILGLMSQVVPLPSIIPLYRKEKLSGMFSAHSYYTSFWCVMTILLMQYPILVSLGTFYFLGLPDNSYWNLF